MNIKFLSDCNLPSFSRFWGGLLRGTTNSRSTPGRRVPDIAGDARKVRIEHQHAERYAGIGRTFPGSSIGYRLLGLHDQTSP